jgi:hypothetical protein
LSTVRCAFSFNRTPVRLRNKPLTTLS